HRSRPCCSSRAAGERYERLLRERSGRAPLAYVTGEREFWSLRLAVDARVLVPRPETETLVEAALARVGGAARIADLGTGSGAVAIALAVELPLARLWAVDRSAAALEVARGNAATHGVAGRISFLAGDLCGPLASLAGTLDAVVSNPPYVPTAQIESLQPEVRDHEPRLALDGGPDGLAVIGRIVAQAPPLLRPGGLLLLEVGAGQAPAAAALLAGGGAFETIERLPDLAGIERVVAARRRG
ncbi:MAG TPA: peptide chain release factor N(5)-glutamine methyltransferase, partial [bacterium]